VSSKLLNIKEGGQIGDRALLVRQSKDTIILSSFDMQKIKLCLVAAGLCQLVEGKQHLGSLISWHKAKSKPHYSMSLIIKLWMINHYRLIRKYLI
jgi:hypothetical protein